jgi:hypothetical protein
MESDTPTGGDPRSVWTSQPIDRVEIPLWELRRRAGRLERRVWWRNLGEYLSGALVIAVFGYGAALYPSAWIGAGCVLLIAGTLFALGALHRKGSARRMPAEAAPSSCLAHHRDQLRRQRDLLLGVWWWYLLPFVPGLLVFLSGLLVWTLRRPGASAHAGAIVGAFGLVALGCAAVLVGVGALNRWAARRLQREIDELDALELRS